MTWHPRNLTDSVWWQGQLRGWSFSHFVIDGALSILLATLADGIWKLGAWRSIVIGVCAFIAIAAGMNLWFRKSEDKASKRNLPDKRRRMNEVLSLLEGMMADIPKDPADSMKIAVWTSVCIETLAESIQDNGAVSRFRGIMESENPMHAKLAMAFSWLKAFKSRVHEEDIRTFYYDTNPDIL